jgi:hypothetical protein
MQPDSPIVTSERWKACVGAIDDAHIIALAKWRGWSYSTCYLLRDNAVIGLHKNNWCFPNSDPDGDIRSIHYRVEQPDKKAVWRFVPTGGKTHPLVFGDPGQAGMVGIFESQWDAGTMIDKLSINPFAQGEWCLISTRGASNAKTLEEVNIPKETPVVVFPQNDDAGERWLESVIDILGRDVYVVQTPAAHKDVGEWGLNGLTPDIAKKSIVDAQCRSSTASATSAQVQEDDLETLTQSALEYYQFDDQQFPPPMEAEAFYGIAGEIAKIIAAESEACREAILSQLLVSLGNILGRNAYKRQSGIHHLNEFTVLTGETAYGRKGTSWDATTELLDLIDPGWLSDRVRDGFQSGEAIVHAVRDSKTVFTGKRTTQDPGVRDKRLAIVEDEFGRYLLIAARPGNTLSATTRKAWDGKAYLYTEGKHSPDKATGAHISLIGHITKPELLKSIQDVENQNGFSNRILWIATYCDRAIPRPRPIDWQKKHSRILENLRKVMGTFGQGSARELLWSRAGESEWDDLYGSFKRQSASGIVGSIVARAAPHVLRLTMLYTVLDNSSLIEPKHLKAAVGFWNYCLKSARWIFRENTGNKIADRIYWDLRRQPNGRTRDEINLDVLSRNTPKILLDQALEELVKADLVTVAYEHPAGGRGRPLQRWKSKPI